MSIIGDWAPGPEVTDYTGPSLQRGEHVIATHQEGEYVSWMLFERLPDGSLCQRFGGSSIAGAGADSLEVVVRMAEDMLARR